ISRVRPLYSEKRIMLFARRVGVHPGLVVGQLHRRKEIPYTHLNRLMAKARDVITSSALTDGWGNVPAIPSGA
ncbi:MAG: hypothetical protein KGJ78_04060, partial [Alphaproteobacteria bacterium]|nr:hypothetical protein [Alphaproteobacteria bacterium]